ncbi:unnamed protein product, partial [Didymodactylos carnosus]
MGYALTGAFVIGVAAYAGYRAASPQKYIIPNRHPESNDQSGNNIHVLTGDAITCCVSE